MSCTGSAPDSPLLAQSHTRVRASSTPALISLLPLNRRCVFVRRKIVMIHFKRNAEFEERIAASFGATRLHEERRLWSKATHVGFDARGAHKQLSSRLRYGIRQAHFTKTVRSAPPPSL
eukprot:SAG11_NODE_517_length_8815_cov_35.866797_9_plen_119_part_00